MAKTTAADIIGAIAAAKSFLAPSASKQKDSKLSSFLSQMRADSIARSNLFEVTFIPPRILARNPTAQLLHLYAADASLPGIYLSTMELKRYGVGPNEKIPYSAQYNDIAISMIGDGGGAVYKFFYNWLQGIVRSDIPMTNQNSIDDINPYEVEFKENYRTNIYIVTFDEQQNDILTYRLLEAYPIWMSEVPLSWSDDNNLQKINLVFNFMQAELINARSDRSTNSAGARDLSFFEKAVKIGTAGQVIAAQRRPHTVGDVINVVSNAKVVLQGLNGII